MRALQRGNKDKDTLLIGNVRKVTTVNAREEQEAFFINALGSGLRQVSASPLPLFTQRAGLNDETCR